MTTTRQAIAIAIGATIALSAPLARAANITIADNNTGSSGYVEGTSGWYKGAAGTPGAVSTWEYQEIEPGMQTGSHWDLAAFVTPTAGKLGVISGFNLQGETQGVSIGDIFVKVGSGAIPYGDPNFTYHQFTTNADFNFDFAVRFNFGADTYSVYSLTSTSVLENGFYSAEEFGGYYNSASQPWRLATSLAGGTTLLTTGSLTHFSAYNGGSWTNSVADSLAGFDVTTAYKYYAEIGTDWLQPYTTGGESVLWKLTMECGNDNMVGLQSSGFQLKVPDGSTTLSLLGMSVLAFVGIAHLRSRAV